MKIQEMSARLDGLVVFRGILRDPVVERLRTLLHAVVSGGEMVPAAAEFEAALFEYGTNWTAYLRKVVLEDANVCVRRLAAGGTDPVLEACLDGELAFLSTLGTLTLEKVRRAASGEPGEFLPAWETDTLDMAADYRERMRQIGRTGYGIFAKYHVFTVVNGALSPVKYPDDQTLEELPGYEREREKVIANTRALLAGEPANNGLLYETQKQELRRNTEAFLDGLPANNVLLYGDAGTGKSSTVKAIANAFAGDGLRLIEVKKNQLYEIPDLMDSLAQNPLKFILFIDDLSFTANDDNFAALKAILEGSVCGRAKNIAVYATSNRRHLIKETLMDRSGDDIHEADTRQELMSLSARFGLTVTFQRPEKARFEAILTELAKQHHIEMPHDQLLVKAEAFAIRAGGRSPRVAKQFIEQCEAGVQK